ncbi:hypothetical protein THRCLA_02954 [Thraustotheca clavata]|uniref:Leucine-rich repeat-containing protein 40 n=1 Tax=Thraustotheca clavata TaxID=74557 RepID=A0A1W0A3H6_9STRA|nr:hypothetical protein THRCLA_02954 [Thraustotheca clavata]
MQRDGAKAFRNARRTGFLALAARGLVNFPMEACQLQDFMDADEKVWECVDLTKIDLSHNEIPWIPSDIVNITGLAYLKMCHNKLTNLPDELFKMTSLGYLDLSNNLLNSAMPVLLGKLSSLKELILSFNKISSLPDSIEQLINLEALYLDDNSLTTLPTTIGMEIALMNSKMGLGALQKLRVLNVQNNQLNAIPQSLSQLRSIATLDLSKNKLTSLDGCLKYTTALKFVDLRQNNLIKFPQLPEQGCCIDSLFLGCNQLESIDEVSLVRGQHYLTVLDLRDNKLTSLPDSTAQLYRLKTLDISNNDLSDLPPGLGYLKELNHLLVDGNSMRAIRRSIISSGCEALKKYLRTRGKPPAGVDALEEEMDEFAGEGVNMMGVNENVFREAAASGVLDFTGKLLRAVPEATWMLEPLVSNLSTLNLTKIGLSELPEQLGLCLQLHTLIAEENQLESLPQAIFQMPSLIHVRLRKNSLTEAAFGDNFTSRMKLKELDLRNNALCALPQNIYRLKALYTLLLSYNRISTLDNVPWIALSALSIVSISDNKLTSLGTIYEAPVLSSLSVENNNLQQIPAELGLCSKLKALYINGNPQRTVRISTVNKGTEAILDYLKNKLLPEEIEQILQNRQNNYLQALPPSPIKAAPVKNDKPKAQAPVPSTPEVASPQVTKDASNSSKIISELENTIANLESQLEAVGLSAAKRYALKKDLAKARAEKIRESRKA